MIYLDHLLKATHGTLPYREDTQNRGKQTHFDAFSHDTRQLQPGELFVAVRGERSNGHDYLLEAVHKGASGLLVETQHLQALAQETRTALEQAHCTIIAVADTRLALQHYARFILALWHPTVIAVTGSVGKTSTKEAIATVLAHQFATFRSWQNYNDLLGLPLSLGRLEARHEYAIIELGCDHPGEIAALCQIAPPQIGVLTNINPTQLQYFGSLDALANELLTLLDYLPPDGQLIFDRDDAYTMAQLQQRRQHNHTHTPRVPLLPFTPSTTQQVRVQWDGLHFSLPHVLDAQDSTQPSSPFSLFSHLLGRQHINTMLAAYTVARHCGMHPHEIQHALIHMQRLPGRLQRLQGISQSILLDDTHNAAPASVIAGLHTLNTLPTGQRIAVLGDMLHLGDYESEEHSRVGHAAAKQVDYLITRGERAALIAETAQAAGLARERIIITATHEDAAQAVRTILERLPTTSTTPPTAQQQIKASILIKGSEETRMERVTELLLAHPEQAHEELVRQTLGWKQIVVTRPDRPTWVEIDLSAIGNNTRRLKELVGPKVQLLASLKADAYGHGAIKAARTVLHNGASMLGVATLSEATPLREAGIIAPILIFGYVPLWQMRAAVHQDVSVTLYTQEAAQALSRAATTLGKVAKVHVKIDTGMGRLGIRYEQLEDILALLREITSLPGLDLEGLYTHFAMADTQNKQHALLQLARFEQVLTAVDAHGLRPRIIHAANSATTLSMPQAHFDMVRPGIALYGLDPSPEIPLPAGFRPALSFKTQVSQVKLVPPGECISYGCTYTTERPTWVATLPVGYADGFRRAPQNWGSVLIHEQEAPILGRVCMDQCMVDVTHIPHVRIGDEVVLIGRQGQVSLSAEQVATRLGTINYEVVSEILARVPRVD